VALGEQELHTVSEQLGSPVFNGTGTAYRFRTARFPRFLVEQELLTISEQLGSPVFTGTGTAYCFRTAGFPGFKWNRYCLLFQNSWVPRFLVEQELLTVSEQLGSPVFSGTGTAYRFRTAGFPGF
jgi:hypothetical protein